MVVPLGSCGAPGRAALSPLELLPELGLVTAKSLLLVLD